MTAPNSSTDRLAVRPSPPPATNGAKMKKFGKRKRMRRNREDETAEEADEEIQ